MPLQKGYTRSSLDQGQRDGFDKLKIAKNGQMEHVERTRKPPMMHGQDARYQNLCMLVQKTLAWHHCMMHATPRKAMAPKMPQYGPI